MKIKISDEVKKAIDNNLPVIALESTIISHGMPYPQNVKTALEVERIIRENGAIPATIGIIDGEAIIGMSADEIEQFGKKGGIAKVSRRDLPVVMARKMWGATTVSATMILASLANIEVFVTGGIGGVHKNAQQTFDISSDLEELAETDITVVCAGAKSILDLGLTLEYLETKRVEVIGYQTEKLPAFYTSSSKYKVNHRLDTPLEIASLMQTKWNLNMKGGILVTNPIPEEYSMDEQTIDKAIDEAIIEMNKLNITGNKTTPYLLAKIKEITKGDSLHSNIELVYNNCKLAAKIAAEYCNLK